MGHLFLIAVFLAVLFVVMWKAVDAVVIFVPLLPSFCRRRTLCIYVFGLLLYEYDFKGNKFQFSLI